MLEFLLIFWKTLIFKDLGNARNQLKGNNLFKLKLPLFEAVVPKSMWYHTFEFCDWNLLPDEYPYPGILGFVCDWKNGKEYTMRDWILKLVENSDSKDPDKFRKDKTSC